MTSHAKLIADARTAWPSITVEEAVFLAAVEEHVSSPEALAQVRAPDLWLACAARAGHAQAVRIVDGYLDRIAPAVRATGLAPHELDEVMQLLRTRLFVDDGPLRAKLASYAGRGPLEHWLRIVAVRWAREWRGSQARRDQLVETFTSAIVQNSADDPDLVLIREKYGALFRDALAVALAALDDDDRELVRRVVAGTSPGELGTALGVHRTTALRRLDKARSVLRDGIKRELVQRLAIDRLAADSLLRLYDTGFELGLDSLLADA
jgi:RNA polymerase sigma-70 factor (ECF subfamily)